MAEQKLTDLLKLFEQRVEAYANNTKQIFNFLDDTVIAALVHVLEVPRENLTFDNIETIGGAALIHLHLQYVEGHERSEFAKAIDPIKSDDDPTDLSRTMALGIPLDLMLKPAEVLQKFMIDIARGSDPTDAYMAALGPVTSDAEATTLSQEQIQQMLFLGQTTKGTIQ